MKTNLLSWSRVAVASALMVSAAAQAVPLRFTVSGAYSATWTMDSNPVPDAGNYITGEGVAFASVVGTYQGASGNQADITFFNDAYDGGVEIDDSLSLETLLVTDSPQLYTGTEAAPVFHIGTYAMTDYNGSADTYTLTVSAVPEPATVASLLAGLGLVGAVARRRRATSTDA